MLALAAVRARRAAAPSLDGFWTVKFERKPSGQALIDELPKAAVLINDTGAGELAAGDFGGPEAQAAPRSSRSSKYDYTQELKRENTCVPPSVAFYMQAPFPMEIYQGRDLIVFKMEYFDMYRVVFLDGRPHPPENAPHSKSGFSTGHWEGDTLVVETSHIEPGTFMNNGFNHSDALQARRAVPAEPGRRHALAHAGLRGPRHVRRRRGALHGVDAPARRVRVPVRMRSELRRVATSPPRSCPSDAAQREPSR